MIKNTGYTILLVEDDSFIQNMYVAKLTKEGFAVEVAEDGQHAIELAEQVVPDVVLLDVMLPKKSGWQVLKSLKESKVTRTIPVLILSNIGGQEDVDQALEMGAVDYLIKAHFIPSEVIDKIRTILGIKN